MGGGDDDVTRSSTVSVLFNIVLPLLCDATIMCCHLGGVGDELSGLSCALKGEFVFFVVEHTKALPLACPRKNVVSFLLISLAHCIYLLFALVREGER